MSATSPLIVYFSSVSENTHRFVEKLDMRSVRIPLTGAAGEFRVDEPYVLICPTYGGRQGDGQARRFRPQAGHPLSQRRTQPIPHHGGGDRGRQHELR